MKYSTLWNMLEHLETLVAVRAAGTVSAAAVRLRLTQSAVSKRIRALEKMLGYTVLEPVGRRVRLTRRGEAVLERAEPLIAQVRALALPGSETGGVALSLALSDSVASSWGPEVVRGAMGLELEVHAHRSVLVVESVRLGRYHLGLCAEMPASRDLVRVPVVEEPMVLVACGTRRREATDLPLITIEAGSATWKAVEPALRKWEGGLYRRARVTVESFAAALQMVRAGFGDGLVPLGVARAAGVSRDRYRTLGEVSRRVTLYSRKTVSHLPQVVRLGARLAARARAYLGEGATRA